MMRTMLKSKISRARITDANLYYEGSITIDEALMDAANLIEGEKVEVFNLNNGARFETYVIKGKKNSGQICLNGPAARSGHVKDDIIILAYALVDDAKAGAIKPKKVSVDERNRIKD